MTQHQSEVCKTQFSKFDFFKCYRQNRGNVGGQTIVKFNVVSEKNIFGSVSSRPVAARGISWKFLVKIQINSIKKYKKKIFEFFFIFKIVNKTDSPYSNMIIYPRRNFPNSLQNMSAVDLSCNMCTKEFDSNADLKRHMIKQHKEDPVSCEECGKEMINKYALRSHMQSHEFQQCKKTES